MSFPRFDRTGQAWPRPERHEIALRGELVGCVCGWTADESSSRRVQIREWRSHRASTLDEERGNT